VVGVGVMREFGGGRPVIVIGMGGLMLQGGRLILGRGGLLSRGCVRVASGLILVVWGTTRWDEAKTPAGQSGWAGHVRGGGGVESCDVNLGE
jgi:hypothetical protein